MLALLKESIRGPKFSTLLAQQNKRRLYRKASSLLNPILEFEHTTPRDRRDVLTRDSMGFLYWLPSQTLVTNIEEKRPVFQSEYLQLRYLRIGTDRRRMVMDDIFCHLQISDHTLIRILERGATMRRPLELVNGGIRDLLKQTIAFIYFFKTTNIKVYPRALFNFREGAILTKWSAIAESTEQEGRTFNFRLQGDSSGFRSSSLPLESLFQADIPNGNIGYDIMDLSTYVGPYEMSGEQNTISRQLRDIFTDESENLDKLLNLVIAPESLPLNSLSMLRNIGKRLEQVCSTKTWQIATSHNLLMSG